MSIDQVPRIQLNEKEAKIYCITRYIELAGTGKVQPITKFDVTDQLHKVLDAVYDKALEHHKKANGMKKRTHILTICGSSKFQEQIDQVNAEFTAANWVVFSPSCHLTKKLQLIPHNIDEINDEVHKRKIELCDAIFVVNVGGYIGESTAKNIEYARQEGKKIFYLEEIIEPEGDKAA